MDLLPLAGKLHELLNIAVAAGAVGVIGLSVAMLFGVERARFAIDWLILGLVGVIAAGSVAGLILLGGMGGPRDVLHYAYGVLVLVAIPVARVIGSRAGPPDGRAGRTTADREAAGRGRFSSLHHRRLAAWLIGGSLATLAALLRTAATG